MSMPHSKILFLILNLCLILVHSESASKNQVLDKELLASSSSTPPSLSLSYSKSPQHKPNHSDVSITVGSGLARLSLKTPVTSTVTHQLGGKNADFEDIQQSGGIVELQELPSVPADPCHHNIYKGESLSLEERPESSKSDGEEPVSEGTRQLDDLVELPRLSPILVGPRLRKDKNEDLTPVETPESPKSQSKSTGLDNLSEECMSEEEIKSLVMAQKFCVSVDSEEKAEQLLSYDRPKFMHMWYYFRYFIAADPLCSTNPNRVPLIIDPVQISTHKFFRTRSINIPIKTGTHGYRKVSFRHIRLVNQNPIWKKLLECECEIEDPGKEVQDICVEGRVVNFSRGVGGDKSFFVYSYDSTTGTFNVLAHICF